MYKTLISYCKKLRKIGLLRGLIIFLILTISFIFFTQVTQSNGEQKNNTYKSSSISSVVELDSPTTTITATPTITPLIPELPTVKPTIIQTTRIIKNNIQKVVSTEKQTIEEPIQKDTTIISTETPISKKRTPIPLITAPKLTPNTTELPISTPMVSDLK